MLVQNGLNVEKVNHFAVDLSFENDRCSIFSGGGGVVIKLSVPLIESLAFLVIRGLATRKRLSNEKKTFIQLGLGEVS